MHEVAIAGAVIEAVRRELERYPGSRATRVGVRVGEFAAVDPDALRFSFDALVKRAALAPLQLEVEWRFDADGGGGDDLELAYMELEGPDEVTV